MPYQPLPLDRCSRKQRLASLRQLLAEFDAGIALSSEPLALLMGALRAMLRDGRSIEAALGLEVGRGQRTLTVAALVAEIEAEACAWVLHVEPPAGAGLEPGPALVLHGKPAAAPRNRDFEPPFGRASRPFPSGEPKSKSRFRSPLNPDCEDLDP
jgi:hypothetical protein